jgi:hypothetical protein
MQSRALFGGWFIRILDYPARAFTNSSLLYFQSHQQLAAIFRIHGSFSPSRVLIFSKPATGFANLLAGHFHFRRTPYEPTIHPPRRRAQSP